MKFPCMESEWAHGERVVPKKQCLGGKQLITVAEKGISY